MLASLYTHVVVTEPDGPVRLRDCRRVERAAVPEAVAAERSRATARAEQLAARRAATAARPEVIARGKRRVEAKALAHGLRQVRSEALIAARALRR